MYDVTGQRVALLVDELRSPGPDIVRWGASDDQGTRLPLGIDFVRLDTPGQTLARRVVRIR